MDNTRRNPPPNPKESASWISSLLFLWTYRVVIDGYQKQLSIEDVCSPLEQDRSELLGDRLQEQWEKQVKKAKDKKTIPSLVTAILKTFGREYIFLGILHAINEIGIQLARPYFLGCLISYFMPNSKVTRHDALISAAGISICSAISSLLTQHHISSGTYIGTKMKTACCSLVYRKCLRLSRCAFSAVSPGQVVNLISNDVSRCEPLAVFGHSIWSAPILSAIIAVLLYYKVGPVAFVGIAIVIFIIPFQAWSGALNSWYRLQIARRTDERVRLMDEIISGIHVIKLYAWEKPFARLIEKARSMEINTVRKTSYLRALYMTFVLSTTRIALFCTLLSVILTGGHLAADKVFVMAAYYTSLTHTMSGMFVRGFTEIAEWTVSVKRLQAFLLRDESTPISKRIKCTKRYNNEDGSTNKLCKEDNSNILKLNDDIQFVNNAFEMDVEQEKNIQEEKENEIELVMIDNNKISIAKTEGENICQQNLEENLQNNKDEVVNQSLTPGIEKRIRFNKDSITENTEITINSSKENETIKQQCIVNKQNTKLHKEDHDINQAHTEEEQLNIETRKVNLLLIPGIENKTKPNTVVSITENGESSGKSSKESVTFKQHSIMNEENTKLHKECDDIKHTHTEEEQFNIETRQVNLSLTLGIENKIKFNTVSIIENAEITGKSSKENETYKQQCNMNEENTKLHKEGHDINQPHTEEEQFNIENRKVNLSLTRGVEKKIKFNTVSITENVESTGMSSKENETYKQQCIMNEENTKLHKEGHDINQPQTEEQLNTETSKVNQALIRDPEIILNLEDGDNINIDETEEFHIIAKNVSASWTLDSTEMALANISLHIKAGQLIGVIGPVGAGKSSLLHVLLGELPIRSGTIEINGSVSYAAQEPWVFAGTVKQNILFGQPYNRSRYKEVTSACALEKDFEHFPRGDRTIVGERGASLSGGQKARINLARAVYKEADIYFLDDPLSAVDAHIGKQLFQNCIKGILSNKTCILITHQLQYLSRVDHLILLSNGCEQMQGTYQELMQSDMDYAMMVLGYGLDSDKPEADQSFKLPYLTSPEVKKKKTERSLSTLSVMSCTSHKSNYSEVETTELEPEETKEMDGSVFMHYLRSGATLHRVFLIFSLFLLVQIMASSCDYWVSYWTSKEELRYQLMLNNQTSEMLSSSEGYIFVYSVFVVMLVILSILRGWLFCKATYKCSKIIHKIMYNSVIGTTLTFFHNNPSGRILNRFSKDLGAMDEVLPKSCIDASQIFVSALGGLLVAVAVKTWFIIPIALMSLFCFLFRNIYIRTSKNLKRLEGIARSPVFSHLNATLQGLTTIRAQEAQDILQAEFDAHQNVHSGAMFLFAMTSGGFAYALDTLCVLYITCVAFVFLFFGEGIGSADVGLVITQSLAIAVQVEWGMKQSADVANQMTSVERVLEYATLPTEENNKENKTSIPSAWPVRGLIEMKHVSLRYSNIDWPVLKDLNFVIQPKEKVGIVGRTGAGKTSLIAALFRLANLEGTIYIDGIDTRTLPLETLRSRISIIPQDPVLFSGTIRMNLDPFEQFPDYVLWRALEEVDLRESMRSVEGFGLETQVMDGGSNFSVGQRQLLCLARAILRNNNILVLDEATANVDPQTDTLIQSIIRRKFSSCTVLTIAHRLHTVMDSDKVMVMDAGKVVEFDHPYVLLSKHNGYLYSLVKETGSTTQRYLTEVARTSYYKGQ